MTVTKDTPELVVVTGMSGAGRSTAANALEDLGWFVVEDQFARDHLERHWSPNLLGGNLARRIPAEVARRIGPKVVYPTNL